MRCFLTISPAPLPAPCTGELADVLPLPADALPEAELLPDVELLVPMLVPL
jgi:hypothetical protein